MRFCRNVTLVYIHYPVVKLVSLYTVLLQFQEPIDDIKRGLTVFALLNMHFKKVIAAEFITEVLPNKVFIRYNQ